MSGCRRKQPRPACNFNSRNPRTTMNLKAASRNEWGTTLSNPTLEEIRTGALQRIADATELMAQNYRRLQEQADTMSRLCRDYRRTIARLERANNGRKGAIASLRKLLKKRQEGGRA